LSRERELDRLKTSCQHGDMWWIALIAVGLFMGLMILEAVSPSVPVEKQGRLRVAKNVIFGFIVLTLAAFVYAWFRRR